MAMGKTAIRRVAALTVAAYAALANYCLLYAAVTGDICHAGAVSRDFRAMDPQGRDASPHGSACHSTPPQKDSPPAQGRDRSSPEKPCCVKMFQSLPGFLPGEALLVDSPAFAYLSFEWTEGDFRPAAPLISRHDDHGPPTPDALPSFLSHRNPRAPPSLASL